MAPRLTGIRMAGVAPTSADVDAERDRRIDRGFHFAGKLYQARQEDRENVSGASTLALAAMMNGAVSGDLRWHGGPEDFFWIAADNERVFMDAQTTFALGQTAMQHKTNHIIAGSDLKKVDPIPEDFAANASYWPT